MLADEAGETNPLGVQGVICIRRVTAPEMRWEDVFSPSQQGTPKSDPELRGIGKSEAICLYLLLCSGGWAEYYTITSDSYQRTKSRLIKALFLKMKIVIISFDLGLGKILSEWKQERKRNGDQI